MTLIFPGAWRFEPPTDGLFLLQAIPGGAVEDCIALIMKVTTQGDRQAVLEHFKGHFCKASGAVHTWSSSVGWAETDLRTHASTAAENAPLFIEAFCDACESVSGAIAGACAPDVNMINECLAKHGVGYVVRSSRLELREEAAVIAAIAPPPTVPERAASALQESVARSEQLLSQGRGREAVQEVLWSLETAATAFRGVETATGTVEGKYFNTIVRELRESEASGTTGHVLQWLEKVHGYLSSPAGGGVRHGLDVDAGMPISDNEARLFCNLIRSYLFFLLGEHQRLAGRHRGEG